MGEKPKKQAAQSRVTTFSATITSSSSAAALMQVASTATERERILATDKSIAQLELQIITTLATNPPPTLIEELCLPDRRPEVVKSLAESQLTERQQKSDRESRRSEKAFDWRMQIAGGALLLLIGATLGWVFS